MNSSFPELDSTLIFYGSIIYGKNSSDLDVCCVVDSSDDTIKPEIIEKTKEFHRLNGLSLDDEIPHENKLIYTHEEIQNILRKSPFIDEDGNVNIPDIVKSEEFLSSKEMKARLLINMLTTDHITIPENDSRIQTYERRAWEIIIEAVSKKENINIFSDDAHQRILDAMYENPSTKATGEDYLGYKKYTDESKKEVSAKKEKYLSEHLWQNLILYRQKPISIPFSPRQRHIAQLNGFCSPSAKCQDFCSPSKRHDLPEFDQNPRRKAVNVFDKKSSRLNFNEFAADILCTGGTPAGSAPKFTPPLSFNPSAFSGRRLKKDK